jgi:fibronectin-binding autotransporter adhesin
MTARPKFRPSFRLAVLLLSGSALAGVPLILAAQAANWTGTASTDWFTAGNWDTSAVPTAADTVVLSTIAPNATVINGGNAVTNTVFMGETGGTGNLTISNAGTLTTTDLFQMGDGANSSNTVLVTGAGSALTVGGDLNVSFQSDSTLTVANGGAVTAAGLLMSNFAGNSVVSVDGPGSILTTGFLGMLEGPLAGPASATLSITNGAHFIDTGEADIGLATGQSSVTVDGAGSLFQVGATMLVSDGLTGSLTISNGATATANDIQIGSGPTANGILTVTGPNSLLTSTTGLEVGFQGAGALHVQGGGTVNVGTQIVIGDAGGNGTATVDGANSLLMGTDLFVGNGGGVAAHSPGSLAVTGGGVVQVSDFAVIGVTPGALPSESAMSVDGSLFEVSNELDIGGSTHFHVGGQGKLSLTGGAALIAPAINLGGTAADSTGTLTVDASTVSNTVRTAIGDVGTGTLTVRNGGIFNGAIVVLAGSPGSQGTATITGAGSSLNTTGIFGVGFGGTGTLSLLNGATINDPVGLIGGATGASGTATVDGAGSLWTNNTGLVVGNNSTGNPAITDMLTISNGGAVSDVLTQLGALAGASGTITVTGTGSNLTSSDALVVGVAGSGTLNISNGATVTPMFTTTVGQGDGSNGLLAIDGAGSALNTGANIFAGGDSTTPNSTGVGVITVTNGGTINDISSLELGAATGSTGSLTVDGSGSTATTVNLQVGENGTGNLTVSNGGAVSSPIVLIGSGVVGTGNVTVSGAGALLTGNTIFYVGSLGTGNLTVSNGGTAASTSGIVIANDPTATGVLSIGAAFGDPAAAPGLLNTPTVTFGTGDGSILFNHTSTNYVFAPVLVGNGLLATAAGTTILTADSSAFTGSGLLVGGTLLVNGTLGGVGVGVGANGTLGGSGRLLGEAVVADGGTLLGVQGQTLTMTSLTLSNASNVNVTLGAPGGAGLFNVAQNVTLDGVLNVTAGTGFNAGVYRLIDYGGALTDNTLDIGTVPVGSDASDYSVQTSVANQVNLVNTHAFILNFWDGAAAGNAGNGAIDGGNGVWSVTATNFTDVNGVTNGAMAPQPGFAVFEGTPGTVTVDDSAGAVAVTGMQFASDGYVVTGDAITLSGPGETDIRVGDGTAAGAGYTATIASALTGSGTLTKIDLGTLILTGTNTYTGATGVAQGTLQIGNGGTTGSIVGDITDNGVLVLDRSDALDFTGNEIFGSGTVVQAGSGTTTLKFVNTYDGGTVITGGTLVGSAVSFGSGAILDNATLVINQATDFDFANVISGNGIFIKQGASTLSLVGASDFTGTTDIEQGILQIGHGGTTGSIAGNIQDNGILTFDRSDDVDFSGSAISGTGSVIKYGAGTTTLSGANSYTGGTSIVGGTLVGGEGSFGTGAIQDNAALVIDQAVNASFANTISGSGSVTKQGAVLLTLTGANTYAGGTVITAGTLVGSSTSFGTGTITDNAALVIDQPASANMANVIAGTGTFTKQGAGSLNLTGVSTLTGPTTVAAGRLAVNGSLAGSVVTVQNGATLGGNGTVGGVVAQSGAIVSPGNSIGALTVNGNYSAAAGSIYQVELDSAGHADQLNVTGTATLANGAVLNITKTDTGGYVGGTQYKLLTAAGGLSGSYTITGDVVQSAFLGESLSYDAHDVFLNVTKVASFASAGVTPNQKAVGGAADTLPTASPLYAALVNLPTFAAAQGAFDQLSGEIHASARTAALEDSRLPREAALERLSTAVAQGDSDSGRPSLWGQGYGSWGSTDANGNAAALGRSSRGFVGGVDLPVHEMWRLGILGGYSRGSFNVTDRSSSGTSDNYHLGGYAGLQDGALGVRFGAIYSWHDLTVGRTVNFAGFSNGLASQYNAGTTQAFAEVGYHVPVEKVDLEPFANLATVSLHTDGFAETGGEAALTAAGNTENVTFTTLGLRGKYDVTLGDTLVGTHGSIGWRHAFGDLTPDAALNFAGGSAFTIQGVPLAQDAAAFGAGFDLSVAQDVLLGVSYDGQYAASAHDDTVKLNIDWKL